MKNLFKSIGVPVLISVFLFIYAAAPLCAQEDTTIYGYFSTRYEKVFNEPSISGAKTVKSDSPGEIGFPFVNIMIRSQIDENINTFVNINAADAEGLDIRNIWGEHTFSEQLTLRVGKMYRRFGLYNEILDAVPTYIGIEPPELFDQDHLIISRTTNIMLYGALQTGVNTFNYSISTDDGEGGRDRDTFPLGVDFNYRFNNDSSVVGLSGYSSGGATGSDVDLGDGSPRSGVLPWMQEDEFVVYGAYFETNPGDLVLQGAYWRADHDAIRDPASVVTVINDAGVNAAQMKRFLINPAGGVTNSNVRQDGDYNVDTYYFRAGYSIGEFMPYLQLDWYENPETIADKGYGGDSEAGVADDGKFRKDTIGVVYRPSPKVAIKLDGSQHVFKFNGKTESYPEVRLDFSYIFGL